MKVKQCNRNPMFLSDFAYDGEFSDGNRFSLRIPERDVVEFAQNLLNAYNADKNGEVNVTPPHIVKSSDGKGQLVEGKVLTVSKGNKSARKKWLYRTNKEAKVGEEIECPVCHKKFKKRQYSQAFCCLKCKDKFHNRRNPDRHIYVDNYDRYVEEHNFEEDDEDGMTDRDWDEAFGVAEYND